MSVVLSLRQVSRIQSSLMWRTFGASPKYAEIAALIPKVAQVLTASHQEVLDIGKANATISQMTKTNSSITVDPER